MGSETNTSWLHVMMLFLTATLVGSGCRYMEVLQDLERLPAGEEAVRIFFEDATPVVGSTALVVVERMASSGREDDDREGDDSDVDSRDAALIVSLVPADAGVCFTEEGDGCPTCAARTIRRGAKRQLFVSAEQTAEVRVVARLFAKTVTCANWADGGTSPLDEDSRALRFIVEDDTPDGADADANEDADAGTDADAEADEDAEADAGEKGGER